MKVVLAKPCWSYPKGTKESTYNRVWPPLELANCAAIFRDAGHDPQIIDAQALSLSPETLASEAASADLVVLTSSGLDRWQCPYNEAAPFFAAAAALKSAGLTVVATGFHGTVNPSGVLAQTGSDAVIRGEPEGAAADLARGMPLRDVPGVSFLDGAHLVSNPPREPLDLTTLPVPAFDLLDVERYFYEVLGRNFLLFEATRGCPYHCTFCSKVMYGNSFRRKTPAQICAEIDFALEHTAVKSAYFIDLEFTVARELAEAVCRHLIARGAPLRWCCQTRADRVDAEMADLMARAGCSLVHIGVESGSERVLEESGKATTKEGVLEGVRTIKDAGMETLAFFMFGLPGETDAERQETIDFAVELEPTYASFHFATPYPGSRLFTESGLTVCEDMVFPLVPAGRDIDELKLWIKRAMRRFYLRPGYVVRHIARGRLMDWPRQARLFWSYFR